MFGKSGVTFKIYLILYVCSAFKSSLCDELPKNKPVIISIGASLCCGYALLSQSDDSAELLQTESVYGVDIRNDLKKYESK